MLVVHLFVCFALVSFCPLSLPLGVGGWLRFVIVAVGPFYFLVLISIKSKCSLCLNIL